MRRSSRGATLAEVLVVGGVFLALLAAIMLIYSSTVRVERAVSLNAEIDRTMMAAVRHTDSVLKRSRLVKPEDWAEPEYVESIRLKSFRLDEDGVPVVTPYGYPEWGEPFELAFEDGKLLRKGTESRVFARLGEQGYCRFIRRERGMLEMSLKVERVDIKGHSSSREAVFQFRLFNQ